MFSCVQAAVEEFGLPPPVASADGEAAIALADGSFLAVRALPGDAGLVTWTRVADASGDAAHFLCLRLARLRRAPEVVATCAEDGSIILYRRSRPKNAAEWLDGAMALLNEAEAIRKHLKTDSAASGAGGMMDLFGGMRPENCRGGDGGWR